MTLRRASKWLLIAALPGGLIAIAGYHGVRIFRRYLGKRKLRTVLETLRRDNAVRVQKEGRA